MKKRSKSIDYFKKIMRLFTKAITLVQKLTSESFLGIMQIEYNTFK